ncbi:MAG: chromosome segregation protein SMC [Verrucomicrobia bacterium]|nr:MAG: chromosome segregation protein SMC [Verrucomicrobiota bacterium]
MILEKLVLDNFRQFKGHQEIVFSNLQNRNVTLVHAENGFGKTALLNALLWGFYGHDGLTDDLAQKERIIHEGVAARSRDPANTSASVRILFKHEGKKYTLTRSLSLLQQNLNSRDTDLSLEVLQDGETFRERLSQQRIQSIMPDGISPFLFFNGERIDHLAMEENAPKVTDAIKQMLGLKLLQASIDDLSHQNVRGRLRTELRDCTSTEKAALLDEQAEVDEKITECTERKKTLQANLVAIDADLEKVNAKLEANRVAAELQARRNQLEKQKTDLGDRLQAVTKRLGQTISDDAYTLFADDLVKRGREITNQLRAENKIPARVLNTFLEELLQRGQCICARHLQKGTPEYQAVEQLLTVAGDQNFNNAVGALDNAIGVIEGTIQRTRDTIQEATKERLKIREDLTVVEEGIEEIHQKLGSRDDEEVAKLEASRRDWQLKRDDCIAEIGKTDAKLAEHTTRREQLRQDIQRMAENEADARRAQRRLDAVEESVKLLEQLLRLEIQDLRPVLNKEIDDHFKKIILKRSMWVELSDDFKLTVRKKISTSDRSESQVLDVAPSTGERQITSLVFIASLVSLAKRRADIPTILKGLSGAEYPMVMDSPFGQLGAHFREGVAQWIPSLAPQVVIFVSSTQYEGAVAEVLRKSRRIGKRYYLCYHGPKLAENARPELPLDGKRLEQYVEADEEQTEIRELDV